MFYVIAALVYVCDQGVKWFIQSHMFIGQSISVIPAVLYIDYIRNPGAAWSTFANQRFFLILVSLVVSVAIVVLAHKSRRTTWTTIAYGLVLGGALGNLTDRAVYGNVVDFIYFKIINFPVFNVADSAVVIGIAMLLFKSVLASKNDAGRSSTDSASGDSSGKDVNK